MAAEANTGFFPSTLWTRVLEPCKEGSETALNALCLAYREPLLIYLRCRGKKPEEAEDLVQGFFLTLLRRDFLKNLDRRRGRFRSFLLVSLRNYLRDEHAKETSQIRGNGVAPESLQEISDDGRTLHDPASDGPKPDEAYDRAWAQAVLTRAMERLSQECARAGHMALFKAIEPALFADETACPYKEIGARLGIAEGTVKAAVHRIRQRFKWLVREVIQETVGTNEDLEDELRYLIGVFKR